MKKTKKFLVSLFLCFTTAISALGFTACEEEVNNDSDYSSSGNINDDNSSTPIPAPEASSSTPSQGGAEEEIVYSEGLEYAVSDDRTYIILKGEGTCADTTKIVVPPTYMDLPVREVGDNAFYNRDVQHIVLPDGITKIGKDAFRHSYLTTIDMGNSIESIDYGAFYGCQRLTAIHIPKSLKEIGNYVFADCDNLKDVYIEDMLSWCNMENNGFTRVYNKNMSLYLNNELVTDLVIPDSVSVVKNFLGFSSITSVTMANSVSQIDALAFCECSSLKSITIGERVEIIGNSAFAGCSSLMEVNISQSVKKIGYGAFYGCDMLLRANFANPNGWSVSENSNMNNAIEISSSELSLSATAAKCLASDYIWYYWQRN